MFYLFLTCRIFCNPQLSDSSADLGKHTCRWQPIVPSKTGFSALSKMAITTFACGGFPRKYCTFHPLRTHRWSTPPLWTEMEHPALSLARTTRAHSPGTTRTGPESWSIKTATIDMTFLRTDTMSNITGMQKLIAAEKPHGGHLKDLRSCWAMWSALSSTNGWPKQHLCSPTTSPWSCVSHPVNYLMTLLDSLLTQIGSATWPMKTNVEFDAACWALRNHQASRWVAILTTRLEDAIWSRHLWHHHSVGLQPSKVASHLPWAFFFAESKTVPMSLLKIRKQRPAAYMHLCFSHGYSLCIQHCSLLS